MYSVLKKKIYYNVLGCTCAGTDISLVQKEVYYLNDKYNTSKYDSFKEVSKGYLLLDDNRM